MNRLLALPGAAAFALPVYAQKTETPPFKILPVGKIEVADLEIAKCDFEPDTNADIRIEFYCGNLLEYTTNPNK
jgi:hypothetical protein